MTDFEPSRRNAKMRNRALTRAAAAVVLSVAASAAAAGETLVGDGATLTCALRRACDLALPPGEGVAKIVVDDGAAWSLRETRSGSGDESRVHLLFKARRTNARTALTVFTRERALHFDLRAGATPRGVYAVAAVPPMTSDARHAPTLARSLAPRDAIDPESLPPGSIDAGWRVDGEAPFRPTRVFSDAAHLFVALPPVAELPTVYRAGRDGDDVVNYRTVVSPRTGTAYLVVDSAAKRFALELGTGKSLQRVTIER